MEMKEAVKKALKKISLALKEDGGDVKLVSVDEKKGEVVVKLTGACGGCPFSQMTLQNFVAAEIKAAVPKVKTIKNG